MTDAEFDTLLERAREELREKQSELQTLHGFGTGGRWWFEQASERLQLFDADDRLSVEADVIDIGSYAANSGTWMWGWANVTLFPSLRERSQALIGLRDVTGFDMFGQGQAFIIEDEAMAWDLAALAVLHLGALGCYRAPSSSGSMASFLAIMSVQARRM